MTTGTRLPDVIRVIKNRPFPPVVITIHVSADSEGLLEAFRAGASDCLRLPLDKAALQQVIDRAAAERERKAPQRPLAKTVGFLSATGGCGGTVLACHFANELWQTSGQTTLLADFDLMAGMVGFWMQPANEYSIWDVMRVWQRLDLSMWRGLVSTVQPKLDVLSAPSEVVADESCDPEQLLKVLRFARRQYDWVLADLGSSLNAFSVRLLGELNALFLVSTAELSVLFQAKRILRKLQALGFPHQQVRLVLNCVRKQHLRPAQVAQVMGWQVDADLPFEAMELEEAQAEGRLASRKSDLGKRIAQLTAKFLGQPLDQPPHSFRSSLSTSALNFSMKPRA
jgi:pilus assembly protein CpaE